MLPLAAAAVVVVHPPPPIPAAAAADATEKTTTVRAGAQTKTEIAKAVLRSPLHLLQAFNWCLHSTFPSFAPGVPSRPMTDLDLHYCRLVRFEASITQTTQNVYAVVEIVAAHDASRLQVLQPHRSQSTLFGMQRQSNHVNRCMSCARTAI